MRTWAIALLLTGCAEHGQTPPVESVTLETTFQPQICVTGEPGDPSCSINSFSLGDPSVPSGTFTLRSEIDRAEIPDLTLFPGSLGWSITRVQIVLDEQTWEMEIDLDLENSRIVLPLVTIPTEATPGMILLRFETIPLP